MAPHVADAIGHSWEKEDIPNSSILYMRVNYHYLSEDGTPEVAAFRDRGRSMSTDWDKYSTPQETLNRTTKDPRHNAVIEMNVEDVRSIPNQSVQHCPRPENRAHTGVIGDKRKDPEVRIKFRRICNVIIPWSGYRG
jgi:hypothetical protein